MNTTDLLMGRVPTGGSYVPASPVSPDRVRALFSAATDACAPATAAFASAAFASAAAVMGSNPASTWQLEGLKGGHVKQGIRPRPLDSPGGTG